MLLHSESEHNSIQIIMIQILKHSQVDKHSLTWRAAVEVIIVLWDICEDAESVWDRQSHHVLRIQKSWDSQMIFSHTERLENITWHKSAIKFTATTPHNRRMNPYRKQPSDDNNDERQAPCVYNNHWTCSFNMTSYDCFRLPISHCGNGFLGERHLAN